MVRRCWQVLMTEGDDDMSSVWLEGVDGNSSIWLKGVEDRSNGKREQGVKEAIGWQRREMTMELLGSVQWIRSGKPQ